MSSNPSVCSVKNQSLQAGGAMVEFTLLVLVLSPLLLLIPSLAKTADVNMATSQAARYSAWEQTVLVKDGDQLATEVNNRFFTAGETGIQTNQGSLASDEIQNAFWAGSGLRQRMFTAGEEGIGVTVVESSLAGNAGTVESAINRFGSAISSIVPNSEWDLGGGKLFTANVGLEIHNEVFVSEENSGVNCSGQEEKAKACIAQKNAILTDSWAASGPAKVERRVRSLVPAGALQPLGDVVAVAGTVLPLFQELKSLDGAFGKVEPDILPPDRYGPEEE